MYERTAGVTVFVAMSLTSIDVDFEECMCIASEVRMR